MLLKLKNIFAFFALLMLLFSLLQCNKQSITPESFKLEPPQGVKLFSGFKSLIVKWKPIERENIAGYCVYYGESKGNYTDELFIPANKRQVEIPNLVTNKRYFVAVAIKDRDGFVSELSEESSQYTYMAYENFSQSSGSIDTLKWHCNENYITPTQNGMVSGIESEFNNNKTMESFGQYLAKTPINNFSVECQFKLGTPNIGGAGLMIRSQKADAEPYYKGYYAYLFWNRNHWNLHLEEGSLDRYGIHHIKPVKLPEIGPDDWIKLIVEYSDKEINVSAVHMDDLRILGTISVTERKYSRRPVSSDVYCGFFTKQYGGNIIYLDHFAISNLDSKRN